MSQKIIDTVLVPAMQSAIAFDSVMWTDAQLAAQMKDAMKAAKVAMMNAADARECIKAGFMVVSQFNGDKAAYIATAKSAM